MENHIETNIKKCEQLYMRFKKNEYTKKNMVYQARKLDKFSRTAEYGIIIF